MKGLVFLNIGDKERGIQFGMYSLKLLCERRDVTLSDIGELFKGIDEDPIKSFDLLVDLIYSGMMNFNLINDITENLNYYKVYDWFGAVPQSEYDKIFKAFMETQISGKAMMASNDELDKAPSTSKKK
jgi:hypothetical protein